MPKISDGCRHLPENVIRGVLRLGGGVNHELSIVPKLLQPSGDVRGLILENRRRDSRFGAEIGGRHLRDHLLETIRGRAERRGFRDRFAVEPLRVAGCVTHLVVGRGHLLFGADEELARGQGDPIGDAAVERL